MTDRQHIPPVEQELLLGGLAVLTEGVPTVHNQGPTAQEVPGDATAEVLRVADLALLTIDVLQVQEDVGKDLQIVGQVVLETSVLGVAVLTGPIEAQEEAIIALP